MPLSLKKLLEKLRELLNLIDDSVEDLTASSKKVQRQLHDVLKWEINQFEIKDGHFVSDQDLRRRIMTVENKFDKVLKGKLYSVSIREYLDTFHTIAEQNLLLQKNYNEIRAEMKLLSPARRLVYEAAKDALYKSGLRSHFREPVKQLLMQKVLTGTNISDMEDYLTKWNEGKLSAPSNSPTGRSIPNLQQYTTQIARDTSHQWNGTVNEVIKNKYDLNGFIYTGGLIEDSRPLCVHLVDMNREISFSELAKILKDPLLMPGRIPGTNVDNFLTYRGGYNCRHGAFAVRLKKKEEPITEVHTPKPDVLLSDVGFIAAIRALRKVGKGISHRKMAKLKRAIIKDPDFIRLTPDAKTGRTIFVHSGHGMEERPQNIEIGRKLNRVGYDVYLLRVINKKGFKNADALLLKNKSILLSEFKTNKKPTSKAIKDAIASARHQAPHVVIDVESDISKKELINGIKRKIFSPDEQKTHLIKSVMLFYRNNFYDFPVDKIRGGQLGDIIK